MDDFPSSRFLTSADVKKYSLLPLSLQAEPSLPGVLQHKHDARQHPAALPHSNMQPGGSNTEQPSPTASMAHGAQQPNVLHHCASPAATDEQPPLRLPQPSAPSAPPQPSVVPTQQTASLLSSSQLQFQNHSVADPRATEDAHSLEQPARVEYHALAGQPGPVREPPCKPDLVQGGVSSPGNLSESPDTFETPNTAASWLTSHLTVNAPPLQQNRVQHNAPLQEKHTILSGRAMLPRMPKMMDETQAAWYSLAKQPVPGTERKSTQGGQVCKKTTFPSTVGAQQHQQETLRSNMVDVAATAVAQHAPGKGADDFMDILHQAIAVASPPAAQPTSPNLDVFMDELYQEVMSQQTDTPTATSGAISQEEPPGQGGGTVCDDRHMAIVEAHSQGRRAVTAGVGLPHATAESGASQHNATELSLVPLAPPTSTAELQLPDVKVCEGHGSMMSSSQGRPRSLECSKVSCHDTQSLDIDEMTGPQPKEGLDLPRPQNGGGNTAIPEHIPNPPSPSLLPLPAHLTPPKCPQTTCGKRSSAATLDVPFAVAQSQSGLGNEPSKTNVNKHTTVPASKRLKTAMVPLSPPSTNGSLSGNKNCTAPGPTVVESAAAAFAARPLGAVLHQPEHGAGQLSSHNQPKPKGTNPSRAEVTDAQRRQQLSPDIVQHIVQQQRTHQKGSDGTSDMQQGAQTTITRQAGHVAGHVNSLMGSKLPGQDAAAFRDRPGSGDAHQHNMSHDVREVNDGVVDTDEEDLAGHQDDSLRRPKRNAAPSIVDYCNPKSKHYDPDFAAKYHNARASTDPRYAGKKARRKVHRWSSLTAQEHHWFVTHAGLSLSGADKTRFEELSKKVYADQQSYLYAIYQDVLEYDPQRYRFINAWLNKQIEADTAARHQRVLQLPDLYRLYDKFPVARDRSGSDPKLVHMKLLQQQGVGREWKDPPARVKFPYGVPFLPATAGVEGGITKVPATAAGWRPVRKKALPPLVDDPILREQIDEVQPQFVMTSSAFIRLAGLVTPDLPDAWELPVTVEAVQDTQTSATTSTQSTGKVATRVIIDKPIIKRSVTYREQYQRLYKYAVMTVGVSHNADNTLQPTVPTAMPHIAHTQPGSPPQATNSLRPPSSGRTPQAVPQPAVGPHQQLDAAPSRPAIDTLPLDRCVSYDLWGLGGYRLVMRRSRVAKRTASGEGGTPGGVPMGVVVRCKTEYLGGVCQEYEEVTSQELLSWWAALVIRPGSQLVVGHTIPPTSKLMDVDTITWDDIKRMVADTFTASAALRAVHAVLGQLGSIPPGQYLLTHSPGENVLGCFRALPKNDESSAIPSRPLPQSVRTASTSQLYNLHTAHKHTGKIDTEAPLFIPPRWAPKDPYLQQVPHTFPPRPVGVKAAQQAAFAHCRRRRILPSAWREHGVLGDWDRVEGGPQKPRKEEYANQLAEDLA